MSERLPDGPPLAARLRREIAGEVLFDRFSRGRYATDASIYQIEPLGVVVPRTQEDVQAALAIAREAGVPVLARGGGTSQAGQTVGRALVIDYSKHLDGLVEVDAEGRTCVVEPGIVLDELNRRLRASGLWFPVDVSTASRATLGGMAGNNSCGTRSLRYGIMRDNVLAIEALLADGTPVTFGPAAPPAWHGEAGARLKRDLIELGERESAQIARAFPAVSRRVGGYNIDALAPGPGPINLAALLVGSEGTLALTRRLTLRLCELPRNKVLGICHFQHFRQAMEAAQHVVGLGPVAVEVVDRTLIELARDIAMFRPVMDTYVQGEPDALLLTEFAEDDEAENLRRLARLGEVMGDLGHPRSLVPVTDAAGQKAVWEVRAAGLNIMMSMKSEGKPVSFIEDCAVPLECLADYTERLTAVFERHGTRGTWYAHASVGCLHVRPVLNLKLETDVARMRAIAEEALELVRQYGGSHSGEHGDGLVRSEFHEEMFGRRTVTIFEEVKDRFDPAGLMNPGKIVRSPRMSDRQLLRYKPGYHVREMRTALDWSAFQGAGDGFQGAVEMCNNNGECRKLDAGVMCPSFRVTRNERDVTRGRANTLRLAISGQLGADALASDEMLETMRLCVSCKACRRECPTGVDMARMKIEVLAAASAHRRLRMMDWLIAYLPRYAPLAVHLAPLLNARDRVPGLPWLLERLTGLTARRALPRWTSRPFSDAPVRSRAEGPSRSGWSGAREVALLADTFNTYFEPDNLHCARDLLERLDYRVDVIALPGARPVCCGRTFLSAGLVDHARAEARRLLAAAGPAVGAGIPIVGLEPSCLLTLRDEIPALLPGAATRQMASHALLLEEFLAREAEAGRISAPIGSRAGKVLLHGHCHQKSFGAMPAVTASLSLVEGLSVEVVPSSCCGMAGAFGYAADTYEVSMRMGELSLLPAVRNTDDAAIVAADGFSCRHQIRDGARRQAHHVARILHEAVVARVP